MMSMLAIKDALRSLPNLAISSSGNRPTLDGIFFPEGHAEALDPDVSLVIGNRGMGKTYWALALADASLRPDIAERYLGTRRLRLDDLDVKFAFADAEGALGLVSRLQLESIPTKTPAELIWRSVLISHLAEVTGNAIPAKFKDLVGWVKNNPDEQLAIFREVDASLAEGGRRVLFLFDQLDQLAGDWNRIQELTIGLMKTALAMKSYRNIKMKIFMRPDQAESKQIFQFPDASKILGGAKRLTWRTTDLYGLLFFHIWQHDKAKSDLQTICRRVGLSTGNLHRRLSIPLDLAGDATKQSEVFHAIAGEFMGSSSKRGRPYTWIPTHLADARGEISPRTFLKVMKVAAERDASPEGPVVNFLGIQEGVRRASSDRLVELEEDYPWVSTALSPLRGLLVPCEFCDVSARWDTDETATKITSKFSGSSAPIDLVLANISKNEESAVLAKLLQEIGVFEERSNGKINVPDIFRVKAGILRKGGVPPQQRRSA